MFPYSYDDDDEEYSFGDDIEFSFKRKRRELDNEESKRPLELGVVSTHSGTVAPGIVLAGILGGLERQSIAVIPIVKL